MAILIIFSIVSFLLSFYILIVISSLILSYFLKKVRFDQYILPLDRVDARKLTSMVDEQIQLYIIPLMKSKGYTDEQINKILTNNPMGGEQLNLKR